MCCVWMWSIQRLCFESWTEPTQTNTIRSFLLCFYEQRTSSVAACFIWALPEFQYVIGNNNNIILLPLYFMPIESPHTYQTRSHITTAQHNTQECTNDCKIPIDFGKIKHVGRLSLGYESIKFNVVVHWQLHTTIHPSIDQSSHS